MSPDDVGVGSSQTSQTDRQQPRFCPYCGGYGTPTTVEECEDFETSEDIDDLDLNIEFSDEELERIGAELRECDSR